MFSVYVLYSLSFDMHYTGYTSDLEGRLLSHNKLGNGWTSKYRPWKLIYTKIFETKSEALHYENWLKTGVGRTFIKSLPHWASDSYPPKADGSSSLLSGTKSQSENESESDHWTLTFFFILILFLALLNFVRFFTIIFRFFSFDKMTTLFFLWAHE